MTFAILSSISLLYNYNSLSPDPLILPKALLYFADTTSTYTSLAIIKSPLKIDESDTKALPLLTNLVFANLRNDNSICNLETPYVDLLANIYKIIVNLSNTFTE